MKRLAEAMFLLCIINRVRVVVPRIAQMRTLVAPISVL